MLAPVPIVATPAVRAWRCQLRGACCKVHKIEVDAGEQRRIVDALRETGDARLALVDGPLPVLAGLPRLPMTADESCIFLGADNLCDLRRLARPRPVYPSVCQKFPYLSLLTPDRHLFGLTLACPTALELFAHEGEFTIVTEPEDAEPPCEQLMWLGQEDREYLLADGTRTDKDTFWRVHWEWFERFRSHPEPHPIRRLTAFAEEVTGIAAPSAAMVSRTLWVQAAFEGSLPRQLERLSGTPVRGLAHLWLTLPPDTLPLPEPNTDEDGLLLRYLLHRFFVPIAYGQRTDHAFLLLTLFASACRYRIERARGHAPILAVRELDRLFVHMHSASSTLLSGGEPLAWRPLAALANGVTV